MSAKEIFEEQLEYHENNLASLREYAAKQGEYIKILEANDYSVEFRVGSQKYLLVAQILPSRKATLYKTFKFVIDENNYGNRKLKAILELNMRMDFGGYVLLDQERTIEEKAAIGRNTIPIQRLHPFGKDYIEVLSDIEETAD